MRRWTCRPPGASTAHRKGRLSIGQGCLAFRRSADAVATRAFLKAVRNAATRRRFHAVLADRLHEAADLGREELAVKPVEVQRKDRSFGSGDA